MIVTSRKSLLFVDRTSQQWILRDDEGSYWILPNEENPWDQRQPYYVTEESNLELVPGHYKSMLGLPP